MTYKKAPLPILMDPQRGMGFEIYAACKEHPQTRQMKNELLNLLLASEVELQVCCCRCWSDRARSSMPNQQDQKKRTLPVFTEPRCLQEFALREQRFQCFPFNVTVTSKLSTFGTVLQGHYKFFQRIGDCFNVLVTIRTI